MGKIESRVVVFVSTLLRFFNMVSLQPRVKLHRRGIAASIMLSILMIGLLVWNYEGSGINAPDRPNLLLILADDLGYHDLGFMGNHEVETPRIDAFFAHNSVFMRNYVDASCQPARAGFMTGRWPSSVGFSAVGIGLPEGVPTLPELLKKTGYRSEHIGKWHLGWAVRDAWPLSKGIDYFYGFLYATGPPHPGKPVPQSSPQLNPWLQENHEAPVKRQGSLTRLLTDKAIERIRELARQERPWMLNLWYFNPHAPHEPDPEFLKDQSPSGKYKAMLAELDFHVGRVLDTLHESGLDQNTIVVFVSDNGGTNRELNSNFPWIGAKTGYLEGGLRTPMAIRIPGLTRAQRIDTPVSNLDVAKTFLVASGVADDPEMSGRDLRPLIAGKDIERKPHYWEYRHRKKGYIFGAMSADGRWRYGQDPVLGDAFYDMDADPFGQINLVESPAHRDILSALKKDYRDWHNIQRILFRGKLDRQVISIHERGMQRTPGFDPVTWGLSVGPSSNMGNELLLNQRGVASIHLRQTELEVRLFGHLIRARWNAMRPCQTIILATDSISPGVFHKGYHFTADLYVNGEKVDSVALTKKLSVLQNHEPLNIYPAKGVNKAYLIWGEYLVENDSSEKPGVSRMIDRLCPAAI